MDDDVIESRPEGWPAPEPGQIRAMLLGTYHMANPGNDVVNVDADDVLAPGRQAELRDLVDLLSDWEPDRIAVEVPHESQTDLTDLYGAFRNGERSYDAPGEVPDPFPESFGRSEVVQVGFRFAERMGHDAILAVDRETRTPEPTTEPEMNGALLDSPDPATVEYPLPDVTAMEEREGRRLARSTLVEYHRRTNEEGRLRENHDLMFAAGLEHDQEDAAIGMLTAWYERNLRTVRTLWRRLHDEERVFLLFGSGHVRVLRHLLDEAPMFCPVSPLPLL